MRFPRASRIIVTAAAAGALAMSGVTALAVTHGGAPTHRGPGLSGSANAATLAGTTPGRAVASTVHPRKGHFLGIVPSVSGGRVTPRRVGPTSAVTPNGTPPLVYHGGPVQHGSTEYAIYWVPSGYYIPTAYQSGINQYFADTAADSYKTSNVWDVGVEFYDNSGAGGARNFVSYNVKWGGAIVVHDALPASGCPNYTLADFNTTRACLTDTQLQNEINKVRKSKGWPTGLAAEYFLFTPPQFGSCFDSSGSSCYDASSGGYCAYHSNLTDSATSATVLYANQPFAALSGCDNGSYPSGDDADPTISVVSHEANETMTDPLGNAWYDSSGYENGDECAWNFLVTGNNGWGDFTQTVASHNYYTQPEWSNRKNDCLNTNTAAQPTASFTVSPSSPTHGSSATFTASASDSDDSSFTYAWNFGDGATGSGKTVAHTYAAAATRTASLVVTDAHGDAVRVSKTITVQ
jgi:hypothetical protein